MRAGRVERESGTGCTPGSRVRPRLWSVVVGCRPWLTALHVPGTWYRSMRRKRTLAPQSREETHVRQRVTRDRRVKCQGGTTESSYYLRIPQRAAGVGG